MRRVEVAPRDDHLRRVEEAGLLFHSTGLEDARRHGHPVPADLRHDRGDGSVPYWFEGACYEFTLPEVLRLEAVTEQLYDLCCEAVQFLAEGDFPLPGLPPGTRELVRRSIGSGDPSLYARFDLGVHPDGRVEMLELNGDTPTGLIEGAVAQWQWLQDVFPDHDQWNSLHERLVATWRKIGAAEPDLPVHFAYAEDPTGIHEELLTVTYLRGTAEEAGLRTRTVRMDRLGFVPDHHVFVDDRDDPVALVYKLYPWEDMLHSDFADFLLDPATRTRWIEPAWKVLASDKTLLAALTHLHPDHEHLLTTYADGPRDLEEWIAKPIHGREGDGMVVHAPSVGLTAEPPAGPGWVFQRWSPLPDHDGNRCVVGSWVVDGEAAGVGIRESDGFVTDFFARFVPHRVDAPAPADPVTPDEVLAASPYRGLHPAHLGGKARGATYVVGGAGPDSKDKDLP